MAASNTYNWLTIPRFKEVAMEGWKLKVEGTLLAQLQIDKSQARINKLGENSSSGKPY